MSACPSVAKWPSTLQTNQGNLVHRCATERLGSPFLASNPSAPGPFRVGAFRESGADFSLLTVDQQLGALVSEEPVMYDLPTFDDVAIPADTQQRTRSCGFSQLGGGGGSFWDLPSGALNFCDDGVSLAVPQFVANNAHVSPAPSCLFISDPHLSALLPTFSRTRCLLHLFTELGLSAWPHACKQYGMFCIGM
jgi:hypothetical protein